RPADVNLSALEVARQHARGEAAKSMGAGTPATDKPGSRPLEWPITRDGDAMHAAALAVVIVYRTVLGAAIIPDRHRADFPAKPAGKFGLHRMRLEKVDNWASLSRREAVERLCVVADIERLAAGLRVGAHERVGGLGLEVAGVANLGRHLFVA